MRKDLNEGEPYIWADDDTVEEKDSAASVAIVILNWNGKNFLEKFLPSVTASTYLNKRIIVADNASTDDSLDFLKIHYPSVEIIIHSKNEGFAKGYNDALAQVDTDYYVLLNSDVEVTPGWIEPVIELMEKNGSIGTCQPKILNYANRQYFEYAGACGGWLDCLGYPFARGRVFNEIEKDMGQYDEAQPCFWATGAAMFVRADMYHILGGLDEYFFAHQEEVDFCWRMQLAGYKVYVQPASVVYHVGGGTLPKGSTQKVYLNFRNNLVMLAKNSTLTCSLYKIPFRLVLDAIAAYKELFAGNGKSFLAIARAHLYFFKWILIERKRAVFPISKSGKVSGWYDGLIVWQYFMKKKLKFSEIISNK